MALTFARASSRTCCGEEPGNRACKQHKGEAVEAPMVSGFDYGMLHCCSYRTKVCPALPVTMLQLYRLWFISSGEGLKELSIALNRL